MKPASPSKSPPRGRRGGWRAGSVAVALGTAGMLAFALLNVASAPTLTGWKLTILASEFGHWFALPALALAVFALRRPASGPGRALTTTAALAAAVLFATPAVRAYRLARDLAGDETPRLAAGMSGSEPRAVFSVLRLWSWSRAPGVPAETHEFARGEGWALSLDFYRAERPAAAGPAPCVVVIHGGGWDSGDRGQLPELNHVLAHHGYAVAAISYRLAPRWQWPAPREDAFAALAWLRARAGELGVAPDRFILLGRSAGGQIALAAGYEPQARAAGVRGVVSFYGPADQRFAYEHGREDDLLRSPALMRAYLGGAPDEVPAAYETASPYLVAGHDSPPTLLLHGARDTLVWHRQSERLAARLRERGGVVKFVSFPWATHAFDFNPHGPAGQISTRAVLDFLADVTADSAARR